jgi:hypothetical protein
VEDPTEDWLHECFFEKDHSFWDGGGNGETIIFRDLSIYKFWIKSRIIYKTKMDTYRVDPTIPWLVMQQPEEGKFFILVGDLTPSKTDEINCKSLALGECGGNPVPIPRECLLAKEESFEVVCSYIKGITYDPQYIWHNYGAFPIDWEQYY